MQFYWASNGESVPVDEQNFSVFHLPLSSKSSSTSGDGSSKKCPLERKNSSVGWVKRVGSSLSSEDFPMPFSDLSPALLRPFSLQAPTFLGSNSSSDYHPALYPENMFDLPLARKEPYLKKARKSNRTDLMIRVIIGDYEGVKNILEKGSSGFDSCDVENKNAFIFAAERGHTDIIELLLQFKVDVYRQDKYKYTALMYAALNGLKSSVAQILKRD